MPYELPLPKKLKAEGWKVKIREKERVEPLHVTVMHKADEWRFGLRDRRLLVPPAGRIKDIDLAVMQLIEEHWERLKEAWTLSIRRTRFPAPRTRRMKMTKLVNRDHRLIFLGSQKGFFKGSLPSRISVCHDRSEVEAAVAGPTKYVTWVSSTRQFTDILLEKTVAARSSVRGSHLITLTPPRSESIPALLGLFHPVFGLVEGFQWLPKEELVDAITRDDASDRLIGGCVDSRAKTLTLLRGHMETVVAPFSIFPKSGDGMAPDLMKLRLSDHGRTVVLGDYEASADAILYELDADYRRKLKRQRRLSERTFGAALLRLRKQRRLKRSDFSPVSSKEIARIERNEVGQPHAKTLEVIAGRLGVRAEEIDSY